jgi:hypothetical protein
MSSSLRRSDLGHALGLSACFAAALILQVVLYRAGVHRLSADESARSLLAYNLSWHNALEPWIWPPFYKIFVGLALKAFDDVFVVPRILSSAAGLVTFLTLAWLSRIMFDDHRVQLVTAVLAALIPYRLLFSVVPLSDIYYLLFVIAAAGHVLVWLRSAKAWSLLAGCGFLLLAQTVRYEACFFGFTLGLLLLHRWWRSDLGHGLLVAAGVLLTAFPVFWVVDSLIWYGSLNNIFLARQQFSGVTDADYRMALRWMPLGRPLLLELVWNPAILAGLGALVWTCRSDAVLRAWVLVFGLPLFLISGIMVATLSVPLAVSWRTLGVWSLLMLPFTSFALVRCAEWLGRTRNRGLVLATAVVSASVPIVVHDARLARAATATYETGNPRQERQIGLYLRAAIQRDGGHVLIDTHDNLDYLDVIVGAAAPELFVTSADADPNEVANFVPMRDRFLRDHDGAVIARYLTDRFDLMHGGDAAALADHDIRLLLVREQAFIQGLDASPLVERLAEPYADWVLFRLRSRPTVASPATHS